MRAMCLMLGSGRRCSVDEFANLGSIILLKVRAIRVSLMCYTKGLQHTKPGTHQFTDPKRVLWSLLL